jgi:hypothetical protein
MEVSNNLLAALVIVAMAMSLAGTMSMLSVTTITPNPATGMATTTASGLANATLASEVHINLSRWVVDFKNIGVAPAYNDTTDFNPYPFVLDNNGSVPVNVSIGESTGNPLWTNDDSCESCFKFNSTPYGANGALNYSAWKEFNATNGAEVANPAGLSTTTPNLVWNLTRETTNSENRMIIHLNITAPSNEPGGYKVADIFFLAADST